LDVRTKATEEIAVTLFGQERSPQPPRQDAQFRLGPAANCRHQNTKMRKSLSTFVKKDSKYTTH